MRPLREEGCVRRAARRINFRFWSGRERFPGRDVSWAIAKKRLTFSEKVGRVIYLGSRAALSTAPGATVESEPSEYQNVFKQGATIVPRSIYFVKVNDLDGNPDPNAVTWAETEPEHGPGKETIRRCKDERRCGKTLHLQHCGLTASVPYTLVSTVNVVLPLEEKHGLLYVLTAHDLMEKGYRHFGKWMQEAETSRIPREKIKRTTRVSTSGSTTRRN